MVLRFLIIGADHFIGGGSLSRDMLRNRGGCEEDMPFLEVYRFLRLDAPDPPLAACQHPAQEARQADAVTVPGLLVRAPHRREPRPPKFRA